jgi:hypothetical protein
MEFRKQFLEKIKNATSYSGNKLANKKIVSCSSILDDDLPWYLKYLHGAGSKWNFNQSTIGTLAHIGVESIFKQNAQRMELNIKDDWYLSGEYDVLLRDNNTYAVIDFKLTKSTLYRDLDKQKDMHPYSMQLRLYKYMITKLYPEKYNNDNVKMYIAAAFKDGTRFKRDLVPDFDMIEIKNNMSDEAIEELLIEKVDRLQNYISNEKYPEMCKKLFWNRRTGKAKPERCLSFCDVAEHCKHYKKWKDITDNENLINLLKL